MYTYLLGSWNLQRTMTYETGGMTGTFEGTAMFQPFFFDYFVPRDILTYEESGTFTPSEPSMPALQISNQMLYEFTPVGIKVFFDGLRGERGSDAVMSHAKYLYTIKPETLALEDYSDNPKLYGSVRARAVPHDRIRCSSCALIGSNCASPHRTSIVGTWRSRR